MKPFDKSELVFHDTVKGFSFQSVTRYPLTEHTPLSVETLHFNQKEMELAKVFLPSVAKN